MCTSPRLIRDKKHGTLLYVGCGKCLECQSSRAHEWQFRLISEYDKAKSVYFVTLTYDDDNIPTLSNGSQCFDNQHITKFLKRIRTKLPSFKYIFTGEYGEQTERPHYHGIMFMQSPTTIENVDSIIRNDWYYSEVNTIEEPRDRNCVTGYVTKYILKQLPTKEQIIEGSKTNRFRVHPSANLGINYLHTDDCKRWYKETKKHYDPQLVKSSQSGTWKNVMLPRYYRKKISPKEWTAYDAQHIHAKQMHAKDTRIMRAYNLAVKDGYNQDFETWFNTSWNKLDYIKRANLESWQRFKSRKKM